MAPHRARETLSSVHGKPEPKPKPKQKTRTKTSIRIDPVVWAQVTTASRIWAESVGITPDNRVSMWVELTLGEAAEQLISQQMKPKD